MYTVRVELLTDGNFQSDTIHIVTDDLPTAAHTVVSGSVLGQRVEPVVGQLQATVLAVIAAMPQPIRRSADLARILDMDRSQAWHIHRMATAAEPLAAVPYIVGAGTMKRFLRVAEEKGVDPRVTHLAGEAFAAYEELVQTHAPDRASFNSMVVDLGAGENKDDIKHKRSAYKSNRHLFGVHADATLETVMLHPAAEGGGIDMAHIKGSIEIQQTRSDTTLFTQHASRAGLASDTHRPTPQPINDQAPPGPGASLLEQFCSKPTPIIKSFVDATRKLVTQVHSRGLGTHGSSTFFFATVSRNAFAPDGKEHRTRSFRNEIVVPTQVFIRDIWLHESIWRGSVPSMGVYLQRGGADLEGAVYDSDKLPVKESIVPIPGSAAVASLPEVPKYGEILNYVCERLDWSPNEFRGYRCRIEYPILMSLVRIFFELHAPDAANAPQ